MSDHKKERREYFRVDADVAILVRPLVQGELHLCGCRLRPERFNRTLEQKLRRRINISGAGICFDSEVPYSAGDLLEIRLMLEDVHPGTISLCTKVLRCEKCAKCYCTAVSYEGMTDEIRELIVKFVFNRERILMQEKRVGWL